MDILCITTLIALMLAIFHLSITVNCTYPLKTTVYIYRRQKTISSLDLMTN